MREVIRGILQTALINHKTAMEIVHWCDGTRSLHDEVLGMETFPLLLALCDEKPRVTDGPHKKRQ